MHIRLRFFASLRERLGRSEDSCEVPEGATVKTVWETLKQEQPALAEVERSLAFAVAQEYVDGDHPLHDNDELAFIPPVSGGVLTSDSRLSCTDHPGPDSPGRADRLCGRPRRGCHGHLCRHDPRQQ